MVAPKTSSQKRRHGFAGFGVQRHSKNQQTSQSNRSTRSWTDHGDSCATLCSGLTAVFVSMGNHRLTKQKDSQGRTGIFTDVVKTGSRLQRAKSRWRVR